MINWLIIIEILLFLLFYKYFNFKGIICEFYCSYDHTLFLTENTEDYYCNSAEDKKIDKCHDNCKTCNQSSTSDNNNLFNM